MNGKWLDFPMVMEMFFYGKFNSTQSILMVLDLGLDAIDLLGALFGRKHGIKNEFDIIVHVFRP